MRRIRTIGPPGRLWDVRHAQITREDDYQEDDVDPRSGTHVGEYDLEECKQAAPLVFCDVRPSWKWAEGFSLTLERRERMRRTREKVVADVDGDDSSGQMTTATMINISSVAPQGHIVNSDYSRKVAMVQ